MYIWLKSMVYGHIDRKKNRQIKIVFFSGPLDS